MNTALADCNIASDDIYLMMWACSQHAHHLMGGVD